MTERFNGLPLAELAISATGMLFVLKVSEYDLPQTTTSNPANLIIFIAVCALGAIATLFPHRCSPDIRIIGDLHPMRYTYVFGAKIIHGHHIDCGEFTNHEIRFHNKRFCAGCLGLLTGAIIAIIIAVVQSTIDVSVPPQSGYMGLIFVAAGLAYNILIPRSAASFRIVLNALLVTGFALVYINLSMVQGLGLMGISLSVFWMYTRIRLSRWSHESICLMCDEPCEKKDSFNA